MAEERKSLKLHEEEDRISDLPDVIIQHILSFLPSTKEAIRTGILSKRWLNQWTRVPILKFVSSGMSDEKFSRFIDNTLLLYNCPKIKKFHIQSDMYDAAKDPHFNSKLRFAMQKDVEELILHFSRYKRKFRLPEFIFDYPSLVKLQTYNCHFVSMANRSASWGHLKELNIKEGMLSNEEIGNILCGCPSLESFELNSYELSIDIHIASKSLKKLVMNCFFLSALQISCPNLEELKLFGGFYCTDAPNLIDSPSIVSATFNIRYRIRKEHYLVIQIIIQKLRHVKELTFGSWFIQTLSSSKLSNFPSSPLLNNKSLTLESCDFEKHSIGIARLLRCSFVLEKLVIKLLVDKSKKSTDLPNSNVSSENHWNSDSTVFNGSVSHLKFVEINGLSESDDKYYLVLNFVEFLLKNAKVLEKLVVVFKDCGKDFVIKVSQELLNFRKCSQHVMVQLVF